MIMQVFLMVYFRMPGEFRIFSLGCGWIGQGKRIVRQCSRRVRLVSSLDEEKDGRIAYDTVVQRKGRVERLESI